MASVRILPFGTLAAAAAALLVLALMVVPGADAVYEARDARIIVLSRTVRVRDIPFVPGMQDARVVATLADLRQAAGPDTAVVMVDHSIAAAVPDAALRYLYLRGKMIFGINLQRRDVYRITGADADLRAVNPGYAARALAPVPTTRGPYYSTIWRSCDGTQGGDSQMDFADRLFAASLGQALTIGGGCG